MNYLGPMLLALLLLRAITAFASDSQEERVAAARRYLEVAQMGKLTEDAVTELAKSVPAEQRGQFLNFMRLAVRPEALEQAAMTSMIKVFTAEDLNALADFYGSPAGRSAMRKFGVYLA